MITGSRSLDDDDSEKIVFDTLDEIHQTHPIHTLVSGHAKGIDNFAEKWAAAREIAVETHIPDWKQYKRAAAVIRNKEMVHSSDKVVAFWDGISKGTKQALQFAARENKLLKTIRIYDARNKIKVA